MKKTTKSKLRLNSQTIRSLRANGLQDVQGGRVAQIIDQPIDDSMNCTDYCTAGCRGCG